MLMKILRPAEGYEQAEIAVKLSRSHHGQWHLAIAALHVIHYQSATQASVCSTAGRCMNVTQVLPSKQQL